MRSTRRNISITNEEVEMAIERSENASKFIEKCILYYLEQNEQEYVTKEEFKILNQNFIQQKVILDEIAKKVFN